MKLFALLFALILSSVVAHAADPYFNTFVRDLIPSDGTKPHPKISAKLLYTSKLDFDGGVTDVAAIYHKANPADCLWPKALLEAGFPPISWTLLEFGAGGNRSTGFVHGGSSINVAPTLLGPLTSALTRAGGKYAAFSSILVSPDGSGLNLGLGWKANVIQNGGILRFNHLRFPPRYGVGYSYQF